MANKKLRGGRADHRIKLLDRNPGTRSPAIARFYIAHQNLVFRAANWVVFPLENGILLVETVLEDQEARWPEGPCGVFVAGTVRVVDRLGPYMSIMEEYEKGNLTALEVAQRIESIKNRLSKQTPTVGP